MASVAPGVLLKLVDGMRLPSDEQSSSLLQVTDIVPVALDEKNLWPEHGFYIKISDSSHSIYASLPSEEDDIVLSNKLQLGQFIYVDRLDPGSPVPIIRGAKPLPGRHPLIGTPEPILDLKEKGGRTVPGSNSRFSERASWESRRIGGDGVSSSPMVLKRYQLDFEQFTPAKPVCPIASEKKKINESSVTRSVGGVLVAKMAINRETAASVRKSCLLPCPPKITRSKSACGRETRKSVADFNLSEKSSTSSESSSLCSLKDNRAPSVPKNGRICASCSSVPASLKQLRPSKSISTTIHSNFHVNLPGKLGALAKDALQQRDVAQKIALQAMRHASAMETMTLALKMLSGLGRSAKPEAPATSFEQFLEFHHQISQSLKEMISIQSASSSASDQQKPDPRILHEIPLNSRTHDPDPVTPRRRPILPKSILGIGRKSEQRLTEKDQPERKGQMTKMTPEGIAKEDKNPGSFGLADGIKVGKEIKHESGKWFMDFVEKALELGLRKSKDVKKVPQALLLKVINWIEVEQFDTQKRPLNPRAPQIARKLRIKMKNP